MNNKVPKKTEQKKYAVRACEMIKRDRKGAALFRLVYKREGSQKEVQTFMNRINKNRANPGADFIGLCVEALPELQDMTMAEFFGIKDKPKN
ncbi:hypothetical protein [Alteromonas sp. KUL49]|uniref:hypothetical protein n=1 Tax=Alteromonas sp. KUL49 TaxID=2480798 RepID=UPI00102F018C|nr:hypothetical protein [Alteromonas sp. KUL49]TAP38741.1 hypothetical protein EYS00_15170 [Alteromonas sp. KUL49]GEA12696.1 hypothetical protein KUL49_30710 [Alteromonas sp. KUL49]